MKINPLAIGFSQGLLANLDGKQSPENLTPKQKQKMNPAYVAASYGIARQLLAHHSARLGLSLADWKNPEIVFNAMLEKSKACRLRSRLASPSTRAAIAEKLSLVSKISQP